MSEKVVTPMDENARRYYLDAMGIQCWESLASEKQIDNQLDEVEVDKDVFSNLSSLDAIVQQCDKCQLHKGRKQAILGRGNPSADLMFVLLSPDANDDQVASICSGEADALLKKMLAAINVAIEDVYISSLLKCSVPVTHTVTTTELHHCISHLRQQIHLVQPKLIVVLGETGARCLLQNNLTLDDSRAATNAKTQASQFEAVPLFVSYSPHELLQQPENKGKAWSDLQQIQKIIQE